MKNKLFFFLPILFLLLNCKKENNSLQRHNLKGKVKSYYTRVYDNVVENGKNKLSHSGYLYDDEKLFFEENGNLRYSLHPGLSDSTTYEYKKGLLINSKNYSFDRLNSSSKIEYINDKLQSEKLYDFENKLKFYVEYTTDSDDNILTYNQLNNKNKVIWTQKNIFINDLISESILKDSLNSLYQTTKYFWNDKKDLSKIEIIKKDGKDGKTFKYDYDKYNNWIKQEEFDDKGLLNKTIFRKIQYYTFFKEKKQSSKLELKGLWSEINGNDWIEFKSSEKFDYGYKDDIEFKGEYEFNKKDSLLTLNSDEKSKKYKIEFKENKLYFKLINGEIERIFQKK